MILYIQSKLLISTSMNNVVDRLGSLTGLFFRKPCINRIVESITKPLHRTHFMGTQHSVDLTTG